MKRFLFVPAMLVIAILAACAQPAAPETAMKKETATPEAMMAKTPDAAMAKPTDAAMAKPTDAAMAKTPDAVSKGDAMMKLPDQMFAAHFVDSAPKHGDAFAKAPDKVLINFNFTLSEPSAITVLKDDKPIQVKTVLASNNLSMSAALPNDAGDGVYLVKYKACWPDKSCHDGAFAFVVDSKKKSSYVNMSGKSQVTVRMKGSMFEPPLLIVSKGTQVTWVNDDPFTHFVNSDPHPSHNNLPALNTLEIKKGESFSFTFSEPGEWAYHCSRHVPDGMTGHVLVVEGAG